METNNMLTVPELSKQTGIERSLIWYWVKKLGIKGERISGQRILLLSPSDAERIKMSCGKFRMEHEEGSTSVTNLAIELGTSRQTVWALIKDFGYLNSSTPKSRTVIIKETADKIREAYYDRKANQ